MKFIKSTTSIVTVLGIPLFITAISAQSLHAAERNLVLGLGGAYATTIYKGVDEEAVPVPIIEYQIGRFTLRPVGFDALLTSFHWKPEIGLSFDDQIAQYRLNISVSADYADDERDNDDSVVFAGMEPREEGSTAGLRVDLETPIGAFEVGVSSDIDGLSEGTQVSIEYGVPLYGVGGFSVNGAVGASFSDEKWNDYYFGVRNSEATADRAAYTANSSVHPYIGISASYTLTNHWIVSQSASVTQLDESIIDSPLTSDDDVRSEFFFGVLYNF